MSRRSGILPARELVPPREPVLRLATTFPWIEIGIEDRGSVIFFSHPTGSLLISTITLMPSTPGEKSPPLKSLSLKTVSIQRTSVLTPLFPKECFSSLINHYRHVVLLIFLFSFINDSDFIHATVVMSRFLYGYGSALFSYCSCRGSH